MVKYLNAEEKPLCRELWEEAFPEDSRQFDDYYFTDKMEENRVLAVLQDGRIEAMLHQNPYRVRVGERIWRIDYIVGVATRKERRHQGLMRTLLTRMLKEMWQERMPFCFLMPADEAIYRPFGFTYIYDQPQWETEPAAALTARAVSQEKHLSWLAEWMDRWLARRYQVHTVRDAAYLRKLMKELASEDGSLSVLYDGDSIVGIRGEWGLVEREQRLLLAEPPYVRETAPAKPAIMARIVCLEEFVRAIHLREGTEKELSLVLEVEDPLIPENDGRWLWSLTRETSWLEACDKEPDLRITAEELTAWLFGCREPEADFRYKDRIQTLRGVFLDEAV